MISQSMSLGDCSNLAYGFGFPQMIDIYHSRALNQVALEPGQLPYTWARGQRRHRLTLPLSDNYGSLENIQRQPFKEICRFTERFVGQMGELGSSQANSREYNS